MDCVNLVGTMDKHSNMVVNAKFIDSQCLGEFPDAHKRDRFARVSEVDQSCRQAMVSEGCAFADTVNEIEQFLPTGQSIKNSLKIIATRNLPSGEQHATAVGSGWLVITVAEDGSARLHILMSTEDASFDAEEVWLQQTSGCFCCPTRKRQVRARYGSSHSQSLQVTTLNCLFSPSSHLVDSSDLDVYFGDGSKPKPQQAIRRLPSGTRTETGCLWPTKQGMWKKEVSFQQDLQKMLEKSLVSVNDQVAYKFPDIESVEDREERCQRTSRHRVVTFQYVSPESVLEDFEAWASPEESLLKVMKFAMSLSLLCTEISPPEHVDRPSGGIGSFLGVPSPTPGRKALQALKPSGSRRSWPTVSCDKRRVCHGVASLLVLGIVLYIIFAVVMPRLRLASGIPEVASAHSNNSTLI